MGLRVELLGGFAVIADGAVLDELGNQPVRAGLLAFLAVRRQATREEIIGLLWPERSPARARHALSQTLHRLRQVVGHDIIAADGDRLRLADRVEVDVAEFEDHLAAGETSAALAVYRGHLLERFPGSSAAFEHWVDRERARLERVHRGARRERLAACMESGDTAGALAVAQEWAELDPLEDEAQHALVELLAEVSGRAAALRHYDVYVRLLADEDLSPLPETEELARRIRDGEAAVVASPNPTPQRDPEPIGEPAGGDAGRGSALPPAPESRGSGRRLRRRVPLSAAALLAAVFGLVALRPGVGWVTGDDVPAGRVVLADFAVEGADSSLAAVVTEALRIDLEQSLGSGLLCARETDAALERMNREAGSPIRGALARELAVREGAVYVIAGQVAGVGDSRILSGRVLRASDGAVVGSLREVAESEEEVIDAIERLSRGLVQLTGRSLRSADDVRPLGHVTTASLDALRLYTEAVRIADAGVDTERALALLDQAVAVDSTFAMAYRKIAVILGLSFARRTQRVAALEKAFLYRERLPRPERSLVEGAYYDHVTGDREAAIQAYEAVVEMDPGNTTALDNLAALYVDARRFEEADSLVNLCIAQGPVAPCHYRRPGILLALEGEEAARRAISDSDRRFPTSPMVAFQKVWLESAVGHYERADSTLDALMTQDRGSARVEAVFLATAADLDAVRGRFAEARAHLDAAMRLAETHGLGDVYYRLALAGASYALEGYGDPWRAVQIVDALVEQPLVQALDPLDYPYAEIAEIYALAGRTDRARALLQRLENEVPRANQPLAAAAANRVRGIIALMDGRPGDAQALFSAADRLSPTPLPILPYLGQIHERSGDLGRALAAYRAYLEEPHLMRLGFDGVHLAGVMERAAALEEAQGDHAAAAGMHRRFAELWASADPELQSRVRSALDGAARLVGTEDESTGPVSRL